MQPPRIVLVLSENWTLVDPRDLAGLIRIAVEAEHAGIDTVMLSEHIVMGPSAGASGIMGNPRDYAAPGNQDPATPWPDSIVLASAIAAATSRIRIALAAVIAPLRHPLLLAHQLATLDLVAEGRLVVQATVSWHEGEYSALGPPSHLRAAILDEQLEAMATAWRDTPAAFHGQHFAFDDVFLVPKAYRPEGPRMWFGGMRLHGPVLRRLVRYGHGFHPFGTPTPAELEELRAAMAAAGRDAGDLEMVGGIRGRFPDSTSTADLAEAMQSVPAQLAAGYTSICFKPSMSTDDAAEVPALCRRVVELMAGAA